MNCNMFDPKAAILKALHFLGSHLYVSGYPDICLSRYFSFFTQVWVKCVLSSTTQYFLLWVFADSANSDHL